MSFEMLGILMCCGPCLVAAPALAVFLAVAAYFGGVAAVGGLAEALVLMGMGFYCWLHGFSTEFSTTGGLPNGMSEMASRCMVTGIAVFVLGVILAGTNIATKPLTYELAGEI